ncbi:SHOCT domain-containing protein [Herbiconiux sp. CPCC 203407]|uniref:SHOCT domain-containing protein n=1 Tax=Herbiconiux oxytropis TaxID=2970915 RepID=A0AA42BU72_9MICO|nr:SHOCT domain-containing protein [Herbiconiux oxytropis]MCS5720629.1 SHOCT domain-containing protein [Herbiconiux oxytropis]MCS5725044.1 SHOCT domain-containing protein [Herbiconiux oxytropis]
MSTKGTVVIHLWDLIWSLFWVFAFAAYLLALIAVVADLFQDHDLNGWWKALWIVALVFVPFLTALVYLVVRGPAMQERAARAASQLRQTFDGEEDHPRTPVDEIEKAKALLDDGAITVDEFALLKGRALASA